MAAIRFDWEETDAARPARFVAVRLIGYDSDEKPLPLSHDGQGRWSGEFDLPDDLRSSYQFCPVRDTGNPDWDAIMAAGEPDPSPGVELLGSGTFGNARPSSILEMPAAPPQPWRRRRDDVPAGAVKHVETGREWPATVDLYHPAEPGESPIAVVLLDGQAWMKLDVTATFDNLIAEGIVPPFACAILSYPFGPIRVRALTDPAAHLPYLLDELLPWMEAELKVSADPAHTVLIGQSLGGLAAVNAGLQAPQRIGAVVAQSSSLWWSDGPLTGDTITAAVAEKSGHTTRFWLEAGRLESLAAGNRRLFEAMATQGYQVNFNEYQGGHDFACWRGGLADGLIALLGDR